MSSFIKTIDDTVKALAFTKFRTFFNLSNIGTDCVFAPKDIQARMIAEKRGKATIEFIGLWQEQIGFDWERNRSPLSRRGLLLEYTDANLKTQIITAKTVPARINYNIWFWSQSLDKVNQAVESYLFWPHNNPVLVLNYLNKYPMNMQMRFGDVVDESELSRAYDIGTYFVRRVPLTLDGWILTSFNTKTVLSILLDVFLREGVPPTYTDVLVASYTITAGS